MSLFARLSLFLFFTGCLFADRFDVGGTQLNIPAPDGFVRMTAEMPNLQQVLAAIEDPLNDTLAVYIVPAAADIALAGEIPALERYFIVKVGKRAVPLVVSVAEFKEVRAALVASQEDGLEEIRKRLPDLMKQIEQNLSDGMGIDASLQITQMVPLGIYINEANVVGYSLLIGFGGEYEGVEPVAMATTVVNVSGKVISLYAYGTVEDLEWTRKHSVAWARAILVNNPSAPSVSGDSGSFDWKRLIVACVGGVAISWFFGLMKHRRRLKGG